MMRRDTHNCATYIFSGYCKVDAGIMRDSGLIPESGGTCFVFQPAQRTHAEWAHAWELQDQES